MLHARYYPDVDMKSLAGTWKLKGSMPLNVTIGPSVFNELAARCLAGKMLHPY